MRMTIFGRIRDISIIAILSLVIAIYPPAIIASRFELPKRWDAEIQNTAGLPDLVNSNLGGIRGIILSGRSREAKIYDISVEPDNRSVKLRVIRLVLKDSSWRVVNTHDYITSRSNYEVLKSSVINVAFSTHELTQASTVKPGEIFVCSDASKYSLNLVIGEPTPVFLSRQSSCQQNDPAVLGIQIIEKFATTDLRPE